MFTPPNEAQAIPLRVFGIVNGIAERPRCYLSFINDCASSFRRLANEMHPSNFSLLMLVQVLLGRTDTAPYRRGWLAADTPLERLSTIHSVQQRNNLVVGDPNFSCRIWEP